MKLEDFSHLPNIDERKPERRLTIFEKAMAIIPGKDKERLVYVAGINRDGMIVLSDSLNPINPSQINPVCIGIEPQHITCYNPYSQI